MAEVGKIVITQQGALKIIAKGEAQKNQLFKIQGLNENPMKTSLPFLLTFLLVSNSKPLPMEKQEKD